MNDCQRSTLHRYRRRLADDIIMTEEFLAQLVEESIFEFGMTNVIKAEKTESEQIYKMLELLPKRGPLAFDRFVSVLERDYPWLATLLVSSTKSTPVRDSTTRESVRHESISVDINCRGTPGVAETSDGDIKKLVASFVHRQFGQSKRVSEKDKKAVEKFVCEQLQRERARYQNILPGSHLPCSTPSSMSEGEEDMFSRAEIQDHLFRIHMKIEPHINDDGYDNNDDNDDDSNNNSNKRNTGIKERIIPDDLSFEVVHREMDLLSKKLCLLEAQVRQTYEQFKPEMRRVPLSELVSKMHEVLRKQQKELEETEDHNRSLLDEVHSYSEHIEKLEKERQEYRAQVNVLHQDMAKVRQEKKALQERFQELERNHKERLEKESTLDNLRLIVRDLRGQNHGATPRQSMLEEGGVSARGTQVRRSMRGSQMKQGLGYTMYTRRYNATNRTVTKKKNNSNNNSSSSYMK